MAAATTIAAPQPGSPAFLQQAYDVAALAQSEGGDQTIAIVDAYDAPNAEVNMTTYRAQFGLPACTSASGCFQKVNEFGAAQPLPSKPPPGKTGWQTEIALDLEAVSAICPHCKIELVESFTDGLGDLAAAQSSASKMTPTPTVITDSWGGVPATEKTQSAADSDQQWDEHTGTFTFPGIATVAASGDFGYLGAGQNSQCENGLTQASCNVYPAALPGVTAAGGTTMVPANGTGAQAARGLNEVAWSSTGSGCDTTETKPAWQTDSGCTGRAYNDLSADGDPATGMSIYSKADGGWEIVAGTSLSSPLIAAYYALVNSASTAATNAAGTPPSWAFNASPSWAYNIASTLPNVFNDPSSGSNGTCDPLSVPAYICTATTGYDGPTGLGTISGAVVPGAPGLGAPGYGEIGDNDSSYAKTVTANSATLQGGVYPNGNDTAYFWQYGTTTAYGQTTPTTDIGDSTAPVQVSNTIIGLAPDTTYHYQLIAVSPDTGTEYVGYDFTFTTGDTGASVGSGGTGGGGSGGTAAGLVAGRAAAARAAAARVVGRPAAARVVGRPAAARVADTSPTPRTLRRTEACGFGPWAGIGDRHRDAEHRRRKHRLLPRLRHHLEASDRRTRPHRPRSPARSPGICAACARARSTTCRRSRPTPEGPGEPAWSGSGRLPSASADHRPRQQAAGGAALSRVCKLPRQAQSQGREEDRGIRSRHRSRQPQRHHHPEAQPHGGRTSGQGNTAHATLSAVSTFNGYAATVPAKFKLALG